MNIGYDRRARFYAAEIAAVPEPQILTRLLRPGLRVAEMPSATGHFLSAYAAFQAQVTLVDCCQEMLSARRAAGGEHQSGWTWVRFGISAVVYPAERRPADSCRP